MKKETLEEAAERYANDWEEIHPILDFENMTPIAVSKIDFIEGAKWQAERMYSEEEVISIYNEWLKFDDAQDSYNGQDDLTFVQWFKKIKKK